MKSNLTEIGKLCVYVLALGTLIICVHKICWAVVTKEAIHYKKIDPLKK